MKVTRHHALLALTIALAIILSVAVITTLAGETPTGELLSNGDFEEGFVAQPGCGMVADGWGCFQNGGKAGYGFYDEGWEPVVASGSHAQLIEINTKKDFGDQDRMAGIYQTVSVVPGAEYTLSLKGLIRANDLDSGGDPWRYVMLVGFSHDGGSQWQNADWQEIDVGPIQDRVNPTGYYDVSLKVTAQSETLTLFIAGKMKWGDWNREVDFDVDAVSLQGALPSAAPATAETPTPAPTPTAPAVAAAPTVLVCDGPNLLSNGGFEDGFTPVGTGEGWEPFSSGGDANYGFYDEQWPPVVAEGEHAQLLEINTYQMAETQAGRFVGVYQPLAGLEPGAQYRLSMKAMIREAADHSDEDAHRYEVYWGFRSGSSPITDVGELDAFYGVPVSGISLRTAPGGYSNYTTLFTAPSEDMVLYLLGLKKWATLEREVNFDFDALELRKCQEQTAPPPPADPPAAQGGSATGNGAQPVAADVCTYIVMRGDTLTAIAVRYNTTVATLVAMNDITKPNLIYVMQPLQVPCSSSYAAIPTVAPPAVSRAVVEPETPASEVIQFEQPVPTGDATAATVSEGNGSGGGEQVVTTPEKTAKTRIKVHVVKRGEYLSQIARRYGVSMKHLRRFNHIKNPNRIYPGQKIKIPPK